MITTRSNQTGFTLIELAVVLVIVGILIGSFIGSITNRIESSRRSDTFKQLEEIKSAIFAFASVNGRIPCPTNTTGSGQEQPQPAVGACTLQHGFVPGRTLGLNGSYNRDNLLLDSWGNPIRYSVTNANTNAFTKQPVPDGIKGIWSNILHPEYPLDPDLVVCDGDSTANTTCSGGPNTLIDTAVFIVLSLGKDGSDFTTTVSPNSDQGENASEATVTANAAGENIAYTVGNNRVFVSKTYSSAGSTAGQYDDLIVWASQYLLYSQMMEAGQLP